MDRDARMFAGVLAAVVACLVALVVAGSYAGLSWLPQPAAQEPAPPLPAASAVPVALPGPSPADVFVQDVMGGPAPSPLSDWEETGGLVRSVSVTAWPWWCDPLPGPSPVTGLSRSFSRGEAGVELSEVEGAVVSVVAYGAGQGAVGMETASAALTGCEAVPVTVLPVSDLGVEAFTATVHPGAGADPTVLLLWRRGDVVGQVLVKGRSSQDAVRVAEAVDQKMADLLTVEVCPQQDSTVADAARSPYVNPAGYVGWERMETVTFDGEIPEPDTDAPKVEIPAPTPDLPAEPARPDPPRADQGLELPRKVSRPEPPEPPAPPQTEAQIPHRVEDTTGPGCGWLFTGLIPPVFTDTTAQAEYEDAAQDALDDMAEAHLDWADDRDEYFEAWADYLVEVAEYERYVSTIRDVSEQWDRVRTLEEKYEADLEAWEDAVDAREDFLDDQDDAQDDYEDALQECREQETETPEPTSAPPEPTTPPEPTDEPEPTTPPEPTENPPTTSEPPAPTTSPPGEGSTPTSTGNVAGAPLATPARFVPAQRDPVCPPPRPGILDEEPPTVPPSPTPPPGYDD